MIRCQTCGAARIDDAVTCVMCGAPLPESPGVPLSTPDRSDQLSRLASESSASAPAGLPDGSLSCTGCGAVTSAGQKFCGKCGRPLDKTSASHVGPVALGLVGTGLMGLGTFLPFIRAPIVGTMNYFMNAQGDGTIIVGLAVISGLGLLGRQYLIPLIASLAAGGILGYDVSNFLHGLQQIRADMSRELAGNPFRGLAEGLFRSVQIEVGAYIIASGCSLVVGAACWGNSVKHKLAR